VTDEERSESELDEAQRELRALADEQAALRRVATLVARGAPQDEVFAAVGREAGALLSADGARIVRYLDDGIELLPGWSAPGCGPLPEGRLGLARTSVTAEVLRTGRMTRIDGYAEQVAPARDDVRQLGIESAVGAPIVVDGRLWGAVIAWLTRSARLPEGAEQRLAGFTELVATAVSNSANRTELDRVLAEQAALRRVATLVARETPPDVVLAAVAREVGEVLGVDGTHLGRYDGDEVISVAQWGRDETVAIGARFRLDGDSISARVRRTGAPARMDGYGEAPGAIADEVRRIGIYCSIGVPITVEGQPWGVMIASSRTADPFPTEAESRLQSFTELVATAVSNASAHNRVRELADEQTALRRVATLVAQETPEADVFGAIAEEIARLLGVDGSGMLRFEEDRVGEVVAIAGPIADVVPLGLRMPIEGFSIASMILRTGEAARLDDYVNATGPWASRLTAAGVRSVVGTPIMVGGRLWGAMMAITLDVPLPPDTEVRLAQFTDLMATAIANAEARTEVARLADEQTALRRVATLVAEGARPSAVFDAVTAEVAQLVGSSSVSLARYEDDHLVVLATLGMPYVDVGDRFPIGGANVTSDVLRTGRTARLDDISETTGRIGEAARASGARSTVGAPIVVDGRTWGVLAAVWSDRGPPPEDTEERMAKFTRLLDTAIANADSRDQLTASRARVLAAGDDARRRVVRDLHDGAQQRIVQTILTLKLARQDAEHAEELTAEALETAERAMVELRELAHGILPAVLTRGGLRAGVAAFVARLALPVDVDVMSDRLPADIEASGYFFVAEALTNVVKHAGATRATVRAAVKDGVLAIEVGDDGIGGADPEGHGLVGIADRVAAHGGTLRIDGQDGTLLTARLPL
jgi:signal transduction histidine kinase